MEKQPYSDVSKLQTLSHQFLSKVMRIQNSLKQHCSVYDTIVSELGSTDQIDLQMKLIDETDSQITEEDNKEVSDFFSNLNNY